MEAEREERRLRGNIFGERRLKLTLCIYLFLDDQVMKTMIHYQLTICHLGWMMSREPNDLGRSGPRHKYHGQVQDAQIQPPNCPATMV